MERRPSPTDSRRVRHIMFLILFAAVVFLLLFRTTDVGKWVGWVLDAAAPIFAGLAIGFLLNLPMSFIERKLFAKWNDTPLRRKLRRGLSMVMAYLLAAGVITGFVWLLLPRVLASVQQLAASFSGYLSGFQSTIDGVLSSLTTNPSMQATLEGFWVEVTGMMQSMLTEIAPQVLPFTMGLATGVFDFLMSVMISGFMLYNKEKLLSQIRRLSLVTLGDKRTNAAHEVCSLANGIFGRFILGQITEATLLGVICFLGMSLFKMPYAALISTIIGVTALVPIAGPFIGTIPCAIILLVIDPMMAVWFVLFIVVLQQIEGDFLYPRVVGNAIGISGLWVLSGILIGGGLFGVWGMLLGVPTLATIYKLVGRWVRTKERMREGENSGQ